MVIFQATLTAEIMWELACVTNFFTTYTHAVDEVKNELPEMSKTLHWLMNLNERLASYMQLDPFILNTINYENLRRRIIVHFNVQIVYDENNHPLILPWFRLWASKYKGRLDVYKPQPANTTAATRIGTGLSDNNWIFIVFQAQLQFRS